MSKRSKACEFSKMARWEIYERDGGQCIFCQLLGRPEGKDTRLNGIMHYIPRSQGGLGIPENGALGCNYHHFMLDNGSDSVLRESMKDAFREYLMAHYKGWNEKELIYGKDNTGNN